MKKDVVCDMKVDEKNALKSIYRGTEYFFCSNDCKKTFDKNPTKFVSETSFAETEC